MLELVERGTSRQAGVADDVGEPDDELDPLVGFAGFVARHGHVEVPAPDQLLHHAQCVRHLITGPRNVGIAFEFGQLVGLPLGEA